MAAPEKRYDQDESSASSEEDFVNAASATPLPSSRPGSAASTARPSSRTSRTSRTSAGSRSSRRAKVHSSSSSESTDSEEEAELRDELANVDVEAGTVRGAPVEGRVERVMRSITKGNASRVRRSDSRFLGRSSLIDESVYSPPDSRATPPSMMAGRRVAPSRIALRVLRASRVEGRRARTRLARPRERAHPPMPIRSPRQSCPSRSAKLSRPIPRVRPLPSASPDGGFTSSSRSS